MNIPDQPFAPFLSSGPWLAFTRVGPWLGVLGLAAWTRWPSVALLVFTGASAIAALAARSRGGRSRAISSAIVLVGALAGFFGHIVLHRISQDFDAYWGSRSVRAEEALDERLQRLLAMGEEAVSVATAVEIRVRDDSAGIPEDLMGRIFEPQFSTRSTGTGLGLAIVRKLVESWDGTVTAEVDREEGTVIRLQLRPWTDDERAGSEEDSQNGEPQNEEPHSGHIESDETP